MFNMKGDTVLDPFLGSGTTVKTAMQNDRNRIGYETDATLLPNNKKKNSHTATNMQAGGHKKIDQAQLTVRNHKSPEF